MKPGDRRSWCDPSFPDGARKWQVTSIGGSNPAWNPNGKELFFVSVRRIMRIGIQAGADLSWTTAEELYRSPAPLEARSGSQLDVSPDGLQFLNSEAVTNGQPPSIHIVENWTELLKKQEPIQ